MHAGFFGDRRIQVRSIVAQLGAEYSGDLVQSWTTHLVCASIADAVAGEKFSRAKEWGIPIVDYR